MTRKARYPNAPALAEAIRVARGQVSADLVIRNAKYLDVFSGTFASGDVAVFGGMIVGVGDSYEADQVIDAGGRYVVPGFIDAHVHIESSMMTPVRFQEAVLPCGTTTAIWDPHEIANVAGRRGIEWALAASEGLDIDVFVMVPSCVPSTTPETALETSGADLRAADIADFRGHPRVLGLAEMMNFPGLLGGDPDVLAKLQDFNGLRRDGHCPGLTGKDLNAYGVAGIHSCHESTTQEEASEKMRKGIHVLIREGSCAKDARTLLPLLNAHSSAVLGMCSDDRNPADIAEGGHIDAIVNMGLRAGLSPVDVFRAASYAPAKLYGLDDRGAVAPGYVADFAIVEPVKPDSWRDGMRVTSVCKRGRMIDRPTLTATANSRSDLLPVERNLNMQPVTKETLRIPGPKSSGSQLVRVIGVRPGQIITDHLTSEQPVRSGELCSTPANDVLKIAVIERHHASGRHGCGFVRGFGINGGAIATSINHDSHNVIVVGSSDDVMLKAVEKLRAIDGGIVVVSEAGKVADLALPIGGLMTDASPDDVTAALHRLKALAREIGCQLEEPFLQLSFLALPVIPTLKITDRGLVDVNAFRLVGVEA